MVFPWCFLDSKGNLMQIHNVKAHFYIEPASPSIHPHTNSKRRVFAILLYLSLSLSLSLSLPPLPHTAAHTKIGLFFVDSLVIMQQTYIHCISKARWGRAGETRLSVKTMVFLWCFLDSKGNLMQIHNVKGTLLHRACLPLDPPSYQ